jgi:hypothetical protein
VEDEGVVGVDKVTEAWPRGGGEGSVKESEDASNEARDLVVRGQEQGVVQVLREDKDEGGVWGCCIKCDVLVDRGFNCVLDKAPKDD